MYGIYRIRNGKEYVAGPGKLANTVCQEILARQHFGDTDQINPKAGER